MLNKYPIEINHLPSLYEGYVKLLKMEVLVLCSLLEVIVVLIVCTVKLALTVQHHHHGSEKVNKRTKIQ